MDIMNRNGKFQLILGWALLVFVSADTLCPPGSYRDQASDTCRICSTCPMNQIIRQPCDATSDTKCGPFYEFQQFNIGPSKNKQRSTTKKSVSDLGNEPSDSVPTISPTGNAIQKEGKDVDSGAWKKLCVALVLILAALSLGILIYLCVTHCKPKHGSNIKTFYTAQVTESTLYSTPLPNANNQHVVHLETQLVRNKQRHFIKRILSFGRHREGNEYVETRSSPFPLHPILETSETDVEQGLLTPVPSNHGRHHHQTSPTNSKNSSRESSVDKNGEFDRESSTEPLTQTK